MLGGSPFYALTARLLENGKRFLLKILLPGIILGVAIAVTTLAAAGQNYQVKQQTLFDSTFNFSTGIISIEEADIIEMRIWDLADKIVYLKKNQRKLDIALFALDKNEDSDDLIEKIEKQRIEIDKTIIQYRLIIVATCEQLNSLRVIEKKGLRTPTFRYPGVTLLGFVQRYLWNSGVE